MEMEIEHFCFYGRLCNAKLAAENQDEEGVATFFVVLTLSQVFYSFFGRCHSLVYYRTYYQSSAHDARYENNQMTSCVIPHLPAATARGGRRE